MNKLIQTVENAVYAYNPQEFFPVFEEGKLANRGAFLAYKLKRAAIHAGKAMEGLVDYGQVVVSNARTTNWRE